MTFEVNSIYKTVCGMWTATSTNDVPKEYLPSACQCTRISDVYYGDITACD